MRAVNQTLLRPIFVITSSSIGRFSKFFYRHIQRYICSCFY